MLDHCKEEEGNTFLVVRCKGNQEEGSVVLCLHYAVEVQAHYTVYQKACGYYAVCAFVTLKGSGRVCPEGEVESHVHYQKPHHQEQQVEECGG